MQGHPALPRREGVALEPPGRPNVATTQNSVAWRTTTTAVSSGPGHGTATATWCFFCVPSSPLRRRLDGSQVEELEL